jgi:hypothetical protein
LLSAQSNLEEATGKLKEAGGSLSCAVGVIVACFIWHVFSTTVAHYGCGDVHAGPKHWYQRD